MGFEFVQSRDNSYWVENQKVNYEGDRGHRLQAFCFEPPLNMRYRNRGLKAHPGAQPHHEGLVQKLVIIEVQPQKQDIRNYRQDLKIVSIAVTKNNQESVDRE